MASKAKATVEEIQSHVDMTPEDQIAEYKDAFDMYDRDKSGEISVKELSSLFRSLGHDMKYDEVKELVDEVDLSGNGEISFDEFIF